MLLLSVRSDKMVGILDDGATQRRNDEGENIPKDKKSVAFNVILQAVDKTLSEKDLDQVSEKIIETVKEKTDATIRS